MKRALLLCAIGAALVLGGCANQHNSTTTSSDRRGLVDNGSVAPVSGGPGHPGHTPQRYQP